MRTGACSVFMSCQSAHGTASGRIHVSPAFDQNRILKIGPGLPGDMNGDRVVNNAHQTGFAAAITQTMSAPLPIMTAHINGDV